MKFHIEKLILAFFVVLLPTASIAGETDITGYGQYKLRSNINDYDTSSWKCTEFDLIESTDGNPVMLYLNYLPGQDIGGASFDTWLELWVHNDIIYKIKITFGDYLNDSKSDLEWQVLPEKYYSAFTRILESLMQKYDDSILYGLDNKIPEHYGDFEWKGDHVEHDSVKTTYSASWQDSQEDFIYIELDCTARSMEGINTAFFDVTIKYTADRDWRRITGESDHETSYRPSIEDNL